VSEDDLALAVRGGLPVGMRYLLEAFPRERWSEAGLDQTATFWLQMHAGFRRHQTHMDGLVARWRAGGDLVDLHRRLIPALQTFLQHLDGHHRIESDRYFPMMRALEPRVGAGLDLLDRDHEVIHERLDALFHGGLAFHQAVQAGAPDAADSAARLGDEFDRSAPLLLRHLEDEEDIVIPLIQLRGLPH
jgi:hypothetical protein